MSQHWLTYSFCEWPYGEWTLGYTFLSYPDKVLRDFNQARLEPDRYSIFNTVCAVRNSFMKAEYSFVDITFNLPPLLSKHKHTHTHRCTKVNVLCLLKRPNLAWCQTSFLKFCPNPVQSIMFWQDMKYSGWLIHISPTQGWQAFWFRWLYSSFWDMPWNPKILSFRRTWCVETL